MERRRSFFILFYFIAYSLTASLAGIYLAYGRTCSFIPKGCPVKRLSVAAICFLAWLWRPCLPTRRVMLSGSFSSISSGVENSSYRALVYGLPAQVFTQPGLAALASFYWGFLFRVSAGILRARVGPDSTDLMLGPVPILRFGAASLSPGAGSACIAFPVTGGLLSRGPGGSLEMSLRRISTGWISVEVKVCNFAPSLPAGLYRLLQRPIHRLASRAFLRSLGRQKSLF